MLSSQFFFIRGCINIITKNPPDGLSPGEIALKLGLLVILCVDLALSILILQVTVLVNHGCDFEMRFTYHYTHSHSMSH